MFTCTRHLLTQGKQFKHIFSCSFKISRQDGIFCGYAFRTHAQHFYVKVLPDCESKSTSMLYPFKHPMRACFRMLLYARN